jgi:hypothetical protein
VVYNRFHLKIKPQERITKGSAAIKTLFTRQEVNLAIKTRSTPSMRSPQVT